MYSKLDKGQGISRRPTLDTRKDLNHREGRIKEKKEIKKNTSNERLNKTTKREMKIHYLHQ